MFSRLLFIYCKVKVKKNSITPCLIINRTSLFVPTVVYCLTSSNSKIPHYKKVIKVCIIHSNIILSRYQYCIGSGKVISSYSCENL